VSSQTAARRLATVLRVAALQERVAKAEAGRATVAAAAAAEVLEQRREAVSAARLVSGTPAALQQALALQGLRAAAVGVASGEAAQAEQERTSSVQRWSAARGRARLLEELDARLQEQAAAAETASAQRLADDLSAGRRGRGATQ
jgi:flagellar biosynthesis chaperone FliJ